MVSIVNRTVVECCLYIYRGAQSSLQFILHKPSTLNTLFTMCIIQMHWSKMCHHHCRLDQLRRLCNLLSCILLHMCDSRISRNVFNIPYNFCETESL